MSRKQMAPSTLSRQAVLQSHEYRICGRRTATAGGGSRRGWGAGSAPRPNPGSDPLCGFGQAHSGRLRLAPAIGRERFASLIRHASSCAGMPATLLADSGLEILRKPPGDSLVRRVISSTPPCEWRYPKCPVPANRGHPRPTELGPLRRLSVFTSPGVCCQPRVL